jgi:DNA polymerase III epsilon subunit-like protein
LTLSPLTFVALDLETTGLSPERDTIIEVAAIRFSLRYEWGVYIPAGIEERTMLVNPGRPLEDNISMITGISDSMLIGKSIWDDVREKIATFIGDAIIVGHNVLFDTEMLKSHGIDLGANPVIDTFELSELLSQEAASLNLGYLAGIYGYQAGDAEHRALGDTKLSISLLTHYLGHIHTLTPRSRSILDLMAIRESEANMSTILSIVWWGSDGAYTLSYKSEELSENVAYNTSNTSDITQRIVSIGTDIWQEISLIRDTLEKWRVTLVTQSRKSAEYLHTILGSEGMKSTLSIETSRWVSIDALIEAIESSTKWKRKYAILITKILLWLETTETGLLDELGFYGDERDMIELLRTQESESHIFRSSYEERQSTYDIVIMEGREFFASERTVNGIVIIRDIALMEESYRKYLSKVIDYSQIIENIELIGGEYRGELTASVRLLEWYMTTIAPRPQWESEYPPGEHGETYFMRQSEYWHRGGESLAIIMQRVMDSYEKWRDELPVLTRSHQIIYTNISSQLEHLSRYTSLWDENTGLIMTIHAWGMKMSLIPRRVDISQISALRRNTSILYGYGIDTPRIQKFLRDECGISTEYSIWASWSHSPHIVQGSLDMRGMDDRIVILTTSLRHIRDIGKWIDKNTYSIYMQGISGGKWKILSLWKKSTKPSIIIGLIDTWRDEYTLWSDATDIILAKLPFDPPTDPYFLARTVGMKNNFEEYSIPMIIIKLNTLIGRIYTSGYSGVIGCLDERIETTEWGKIIARELL